MKQSRRQFLGTLLGGAGWAVLGRGTAAAQALPQATLNRPVRRNVAKLAANHPILTAYASAIAKMKALPPSDPRNWTNQANIHLNHCPHGNWLFLPWHRAYVLYFERICRKLSGMADFALPYWNWSGTPRVPAPFWTGQLLDTSRVATAASVADSTAVGAQVVSSILDEPNFVMFGSGSIAAGDDQRAQAAYGRLEGTPHNYIHGFVGGDMGAFLSPLDPVFWLHHAMVERCWVAWNFDRGHANPNDPGWLGRTFTDFCDEDGNPVRVTVAETLLYPASYYRYDDVGSGATGSDPSAPDSKAAQDVAMRKAKNGAAVQLAVLQRFTASQPAACEIDKPTAIRIPVNPRALRAAGGRTLLALQGVSLDHTEDFSVRVFLGKPDATVHTPPSDPHYAGTFAFFGHQGAGGAGHAHGPGSFVLDVGEVVKRLDIKGGTLEANVVLVPFPGRKLRTRKVTISTTELRLCKDVVHR